MIHDQNSTVGLYHGLKNSHACCTPSPGEEDLDARELLRRAYSAGPVSPICYGSKRPRAGYAL